MESKKELADRFIESHRTQWGVFAHELLHQVPMAEAPLLWSKNSHYQFGFNGLHYNDRVSPHCLYSVDYGPIARRPEDFASEMVRALQEISDKLGTVALPQTSSLTSCFLIKMAERSGISFKTVSVPFELRAFENYIEDFASRNNVGSVEVIWKAYVERFTDLPVIYESRPLRLIDHNYDVIQNKGSGFPNWGIYELEKNTCIHRHLQRQGRPGIPNIFVWSPELMAAQLLYPEWLELLQQEVAVQSNFEIENKVLRELAQVKLGWQEVSPLWSHKEKWARMDKELRMRRWGIANDASNYPLHRLVKKWRLSYPLDHHTYEGIYGMVL